MTAPDRPVHEQVLAADEQATAGPWEHDTTAVVYPDGRGIWALPDRDAALIALYRTAAPVLARQVQAALALHEKLPSGACSTCFNRRFPCPTVRALTEVGE